MKKQIAKFSPKQIMLALVAVISLIFSGILTFMSQEIKQSLDDQRGAERWSEDGTFTQVSCFFAETVPIDWYQILSFRNQIEIGLKEASLEASGENQRMYIDSYSSQGTVVIETGKTRLEADAIGVGGDFFRFHPVKLLTGSYFSGSDLMQDYIVIDENAAWQLFGSNDVVGMQVTIGGVPHYIAGVISREEGRMWEAAGLDDSMVYLSHDSLSAYGVTGGIKQYEAVMPNPVSGFAYRLVKEKFGFDEYNMEVVDNTHRYTMEPLIAVIADFGLRSMQHHAIRYPYWENYARGYEDILAFILIFQLIFLLIPVSVSVIALIQGYRHRTWNRKSLWKGFRSFIVYIRAILKNENGVKRVVGSIFKGRKSEK